MAGTKNLVSLATRPQQERIKIARMGQIACTKKKKEKATMRETLKLLLETEAKNGQTYREQATIGLLKGAVKGDPRNYKTILEVLGEINGNDKPQTNGVIDDLIEALNDVKKNK